MVQPINHEALGDELVRVVKLLHAARAQAPLPAGLDHSAYPILFVLDREPHRVSDLAEEIHSDVSTVSRQVAGLVRAGYVDRAPDPDDGRAHVLSLSPQYRAIPLISDPLAYPSALTRSDPPSIGRNGPH